MPLAGARLLDSTRQASAVVTIAAVTGWRFFVELSIVAGGALSACAQHSLDELGVRS